MAIILIFLCGIINFALHKATMESDHPMAVQMRGIFRHFMRGWGTYFLEYLILLSAFSFAALGYTIALPAYIVYTGMNGRPAGRSSPAGFRRSGRHGLLGLR